MRVGVSGASALVACILASSALVGEAAATEQACTVSDNANVRGGPCKSYDILTGRPKAFKGQQVRVLDRICPSADDCDDDFGGCWARLDGGGWLAYEKLTKCVAIKPAPALLSPPPKPTSVTVKPTPVAPLPVIPLPTQAPLAAFGGKSLQFIDKEALTWGGCRDACKQRFNGDLAVLSACGARCKGKTDLWIGATKLGNKWKWVTDKTFAEGCEFSYLESPPGAYSAVNGHFRCGALNCVAYRIDGKVWNNYSCQEKRPCVCLV